MMLTCTIKRTGGFSSLADLWKTLYEVLEVR